MAIACDQQGLAQFGTAGHAAGRYRLAGTVANMATLGCGLIIDRFPLFFDGETSA
jgi:hypothetical protein